MTHINGDIDYINITLRRVIIKTDVMVFEIRKGGEGGFQDDINKDVD